MRVNKISVGSIVILVTAIVTDARCLGTTVMQSALHRKTVVSSINSGNVLVPDKVPQYPVRYGTY